MRFTLGLHKWCKQRQMQQHLGQQAERAPWQPVAQKPAAEERGPDRVEADEEHRTRRVGGEEGEGEAELLANLQERFDLLVDRKAYFDPAMQDLLAFCHDPAFRQRAESLGGYDLADFGRVVWNG